MDIRWGARLVALGLLAVSAGWFAVPAVAEEPEIELPVSFDNVWYRPATKSGFGTGKQKGLLTVTEEGLEFAASKRSDFVPWSRVEMLSYGAMAGDTDTRWVVLRLQPVGGVYGYAGFRDGSKMGYGQGTVPIFDAIAAGLKGAGTGPYDVPAGYVPYITRYLQFSLALPEGWIDYEISNTLSDGRPLWGETLFSALDLPGMRGDTERTRTTLRAISAGEVPSILLLRYEGHPGFGCDVLKKGGRRQIHEEVDAALRPYRLSADTVWNERRHRVCTAWTTETTLEADGTAVEARLFAVSDGQTVYVLILRGSSGEPDVARFETIAESLRTAAAR